jgi:hypothetical protein
MRDVRGSAEENGTAAGMQDCSGLAFSLYI